MVLLGLTRTFSSYYQGPWHASALPAARDGTGSPQGLHMQGFKWGFRKGWILYWSLHYQEYIPGALIVSPTVGTPNPTLKLEPLRAWSLRPSGVLHARSREVGLEDRGLGIWALPVRYTTLVYRAFHHLGSSASSNCEYMYE